MRVSWPKHPAIKRTSCSPLTSIAWTPRFVRPSRRHASRSEVNVMSPTAVIRGGSIAISPGSSAIVRRSSAIVKGWGQVSDPFGGPSTSFMMTYSRQRFRLRGREDAAMGCGSISSGALRRGGMSFGGEVRGAGSAARCGALRGRPVSGGEVAGFTALVFDVNPPPFFFFLAAPITLPTPEANSTPRKTRSPMSMGRVYGARCRPGILPKDSDVG